MTEPSIDPLQDSARKAVDAEVAIQAAMRERADRIRSMIDDFPFQPVGNRVVIMQRRPDFVSEGKHGAKILLVRDESFMPLTGWIVAVPDKRHRQFVDGKWFILEPGFSDTPVDPTYDGLCPYAVGDEVVFPDHASSPINVDIEEEPWEFLVMEYRDVLGKIKGGAVTKVSSVVPGLEEQRGFTAEDVKAAYPAPPEA